jgi:protease-4
MELVKEKKPVIVSMGGLAASGGYYISCPADVILAGRSTLTGSIGVFGIYFDLSDALRDKLGITVDVVKTNPSADLGSGFRPVDSYERRYLMKQVESTYATFVNHVAAGRNMSPGAVDAIGGGRVWSGVDAMGNGLADGHGGILDAIELAADRAGVSDNYMVWQVTDSPDNISAIVRTLLSSEGAKFRSELGDAWRHYNSVKNVLESEGVQARALYDIELW